MLIKVGGSNLTLLFGDVSDPAPEERGRHQRMQKTYLCDHQSLKNEESCLPTIVEDQMVLKFLDFNQVWWFMLGIPILGKWKQENPVQGHPWLYIEFEVSLGY